MSEHKDKKTGDDPKVATGGQTADDAGVTGRSSAGNRVTDGDGSRETVDTKTAKSAAAADGRVTGAASGRRWAFAAPLALLAVIVAALALATSGFLWWQYRQFYVSLADADSAQGRLLDSLEREQTELDRAIDAVQQRLAEDRDRIVDLRTAVGDFPQQIGALDRRLDALQGRSLDARDVWLRAEAEYYLVVANTELALSGRVENAITALELADGLLRELGDPSLNPVRVAIADELTNLRAVPLVDNAGLAFSLASLATRVPALPFREAGTTRFEAGGPSLDNVEPGLGRLWESLRRAVLGIVRIERRDRPVDVLLTAGERSAIRRQLGLELQLARIALLRSESEAFRASLVAARALLSSEFDTGAPGVAGALELIDELGRLDIDPQLPDLGGSLSLLRAAVGSAG